MRVSKSDLYHSADPAYPLARQRERGEARVTKLRAIAFAGIIGIWNCADKIVIAGAKP
jgi:hypothetical protein